MLIKALIFDLGGTLFYFDGDWPEVFAQADAELIDHLKAGGLDFDEGTFIREFRTRLNRYYAERESEFIEYTTGYILRTLLADRGYPEVPEPIIRAGLRAMYAVSQAHWLPEPDVIPTLDVLREKGYRLGVISNAGDDDDVQTLVDKAGIRAYLDFILTSAAAGVRKPNPRIFNLALNFWGISPARVAMIGDTLGADVLGAQNAGLYSIWITRRADIPGNRAHVDTIHPDAAITNLSELPDLLTQLS
jgi:HAD superfamily hydrolase (TIGR01662 family)